MPRSSTPSFITELPLKVCSQTDRELLSRFQAARQLYNACLNESMVRVELLRNSSLYQEAKAIRRDQKKKRSSLFKKARESVRYSEYDLHSYSAKVSKASGWIREKLDSNIVQTIATRAFRASEKVLLGKAKKVRFKVSSRFRSVENKTNKFGLRWKDNQVIWKDLRIVPVVDDENPVIQHGLASPVKYCRILYRILNGKRRWYVQLINQGEPYQKPKNYVTSGVVGIDLNVSTVAIVAEDYSELAPFCLQVEDQQKKIKALQRKMSRSQRKSNPNNFEPDFTCKRGRKTVVKKGKVIRGKKGWKKSNHYRKLQNKLAELNRKQSAYRKSEQRQLVNNILRHGSEIKMENVSVKAWQKTWGKAIKVKSPGFFQSELCRKAESADGIAEKFSTRNTKLSQTCICGNPVKKSLSQRVHRCKCGVTIHRDLMSGFLARHVNQGQLSLQSARDGWLGSESILQAAWQRYDQKIIERVSDAESRKTDSPLEIIACESSKNNQTETGRLNGSYLETRSESPAFRRGV